MAILSKCMYCDKMVSHRVSSLPICEDHDGSKDRAERDRVRWNALTIEQKLDELKARLDHHINNPPFDSTTPIG